MKPNLLLFLAMLIVQSPALHTDAHADASLLTERTGPIEAMPSGARQETAHLVTVLVPTLDDTTASALVIRRPKQPRNLILVTAETTPGEFLNALRALNASRRDAGEEPPDEIRAFIRRAGGADVRDATALARAAEHLSRVKAAPERSIEGVGSHRAVTTSLPRVRP